jgi:hypothetical protein
MYLSMSMSMSMLMPMSISMSMSMSMDYDMLFLPTIESNLPSAIAKSSPSSVSPASATPAPSPPITLLESSDPGGAAPITLLPVRSEPVAPVDVCVGQPSARMTVYLEVELAVGKEDFSDDLARILGIALSVEYPSCDGSRRRQAARGDDSMRDLQSDGGVTRMGAITVEETEGRCDAHSMLARSCRRAEANIDVFGGGDDATGSIGTSLKSITGDNERIANELRMSGILDVRVVNTPIGGSTTPVTSDQTTSTSDINSSNSSPAGGRSESGRATMAIVLSVLGVSVVLVVILRRGSRLRRRHRRTNLMEYAPTFDAPQGDDSNADADADVGAYSPSVAYGFADSTPINSSTVASC